MLYYCIKNKLLSSLKNSKNFNGFTLTEVLLAVAIVGIIAALVLPATVSKFNEKTLDLGYEREVKTISSAVDSLVVSENKKDFFSTMMYTDVEPESYDDTSGKFLKKYLKISKYCGSDASDCFASKYYEYKDNQKKEYTPDYKGSCGRLKNGMSICITPQIGAKSIEGLIDINGRKGPNIFGRDLRTFLLDSKTRTGRVEDTTEVLAHNNGYIELQPEEPETPPDPCSIDNNSLDCCKTRAISGTTDACCTYNEFKNNSSCLQNITVTLTCSTDVQPSASQPGCSYAKCNYVGYVLSSPSTATTVKSFSVYMDWGKDYWWQGKLDFTAPYNSEWGHSINNGRIGLGHNAVGMTSLEQINGRYAVGRPYTVVNNDRGQSTNIQTARVTKCSIVVPGGESATINGPGTVSVKIPGRL